jgi:hypothetical protein
MTQEDIIRMAREAGCYEASHPMNPWSVPQETLERFFRLAYESGAAAERAACADICDQHASVEGIAQRCAAEIRARNK